MLHSLMGFANLVPETLDDRKQYKHDMKPKTLDVWVGLPPFSELLYGISLLGPVSGRNLPFTKLRRSPPGAAAYGQDRPTPAIRGETNERQVNLNQTSRLQVIIKWKASTNQKNAGFHETCLGRNRLMFLLAHRLCSRIFPRAC